MKYTNDGYDERVYPTLGVTLKPKESFDDVKSVVKEVVQPSVTPDTIVSEVK
jgi:hypothetical protein